MADSSGDNDDNEKTEDPSAYRLEQFRKKGDIAVSQELNHLVLLVSVFAVLAISYEHLIIHMDKSFHFFLEVKTNDFYNSEKRWDIFVNGIMTFLYCLLPILSTSFLVSLIMGTFQTGFLFAPEILELKWDRINPINGISRLFSIRSLVELFKSILKLSFAFGVSYYVLKDDWLNFMGLLHVDGMDFSFFSKGVFLRLIFSLLGAHAVVSAIDFTYQKISYKNKTMTTKQEAKTENKEQEGNPEIKQRMRAAQRQAAQKRMMNDVKSADVIVTNPTHLSVAIQYNQEKMSSPQVVAKGADFVALRIREIANENNIPIVENVPLARALYKDVKIGGSVPRELYKAVAEVLAFIYRKKASNGKRWLGSKKN